VAFLGGQDCFSVLSMEAQWPPLLFSAACVDDA
jgi:hypothetical protein